MHFTPCVSHGITVTFTVNHDGKKKESIVRNCCKTQTRTTASLKYIPVARIEPPIKLEKRKSSRSVSFEQDLTSKRRTNDF